MNGGVPAGRTWVHRRPAGFGIITGMVPGMRLASRYEIEHRIGRGGMGDVWAGTDTVLGREVAIKTVDLSATDDPAAEERFGREARATASLSHGNIVSIFDFGTDEAVAFLVMELLPGPTLAEVIAQRGPLPVADAVEMAEQVASALAAAHAVGVVHRDIKPGNLMLDARGQLKVVDFGIARLLESASKQLTATAMVIGSAAYMAPEQAAGQPATASTDLYALGCVLMAMLTGEPPFSAEHPLAVVQQQLNSPPPSVLDRRPDAPPAVESLVQHLLAKAPEDRPADADQVRRGLAEIRSGVSGDTRVFPSTTAAAQSGDAPLRRRAWLPVVIIAAVALVGAVLVKGLLSSGGPTVGAAPPTRRAFAATLSTRPSRTTTAPSRSPTTRAPKPLTTRQALRNLSHAVDAAAADGQAQQPAHDDLSHRVEDLVKTVTSGKTEDLSHKLEDFSRKLSDLAREGKLTPAGEARIRKALSRVP